MWRTSTIRLSRPDTDAWREFLFTYMSYARAVEATNLAHLRRTGKDRRVQARRIWFILTAKSAHRLSRQTLVIQSPCPKPARQSWNSIEPCSAMLTDPPGIVWDRRTERKRRPG
jgi:hypothetical protein